MKTWFEKILVLVIIFGALAPLSNISAQDGSRTENSATNAAKIVVSEQSAKTLDEVTKAGKNSGGDSCGILNIGQCFSDVILLLPGYVALTTLKIAQWFTHISGMMLNYVVYYTVVNMKANISDAQTLSDAWRTIRDVGNMGFIFILLYAAIRTIIGGGGDNQKLVARVVVVAILINFSLFFTRFIIDISNVLAITFYDAIAPGALDKTFTQGLSGSLMEPLRLQSIFDVSSGLTIFSGEKIFIIGVAGTIFSLIAAFVFFAISILLIIRFVVLVFVMILSPIAFLSFILPQMKGYATQWWNALSGQAFFAPIYFLLTWVVIVVSRSMLKGGSFANLAGTSTAGGGTGAPPLETIEMIVNFAIVISMLVFSLVTAKSWANKAPGGISKIASMATGAIYGGAVGWAGRRTVGWGGSVIADRADLQKAANEGTGVRGAAARLALYTAKKARSGTFDARNATIPTNALGDAVRGTAGRTALGKKLGLDRTEFASISAGAYAAAATGSGTGVKDGFVERRDAKTKRMEAEKKKADEEYREIKDRNNILEGVSASGELETLTAQINALGVATPAQAAQQAQLQKKVDAMEKAVSSASEKEIEAIVESNKKLLESQTFANTLSSKQLEALNKSDKFSETEKDTLKGARFKEINTAMVAGGAGAGSVGGKIKGLSDAELEMIDPEYLKSSDFIEQMRPPQRDTIMKSNKFTSSQKQAFSVARKEKLLNALAAGSVADAQLALRNMTHKDVAVMKMTDLTNPTMIQAYNKQLLKRMASEMNAADVPILRQVIIDEPVRLAAIGAVVPPELAEIAKWLISRDGRNSFS